MRARRLACVDVGSNTVTLVIAESRDGDWAPLHQEARITRLGAGLDRTGRLDPGRLRVTLAALGEMAAVARTHGAEPLVGVATAAAREAEDGARLVEEAARLGVSLEIVDGETEASLVWLASWRSFGVPGRPMVVVDVGGRSTEIIDGDGASPTARISLRVGSVRLTEAHVRGDPPGDAERRAVESAARAVFAAAPRPSTDDDPTVVAVAGTATTLAAVHLALPEWDAERVHGLRLTRADLDRWRDRLWSLDLEARRALPGMIPERADVLPAGAAILSAALDHMGAGSIKVSDRGVRWGVLFQRATG